VEDNVSDADGLTYHNNAKVMPLEAEADRQSKPRIARAQTSPKQDGRDHGARVYSNIKKPDSADFAIGDDGELVSPIRTCPQWGTTGGELLARTCRYFSDTWSSKITTIVHVVSGKPANSESAKSGARAHLAWRKVALLNRSECIVLCDD